MEKADIDKLIENMKKKFPYNEEPEPDSDDDFCRHAYENGYYRGWNTVMMALRLELSDPKYKALKRRPRS